jgi:hypothetical protein
MAEIGDVLACIDKLIADGALDADVIHRFREAACAKRGFPLAVYGRDGRVIGHTCGPTTI